METENSDFRRIDADKSLIEESSKIDKRDMAFETSPQEDYTSNSTVEKKQEKQKRNYPIERKQAPTWECPICHKVISARGNTGHLEKVHDRGLPPKEFDPYPLTVRAEPPNGRPVAPGDITALVKNVCLVYSQTVSKYSLSGRRRVYRQYEYLCREFEINFNCTLEEALNKYSDLGLS